MIAITTSGIATPKPIFAPVESPDVLESEAELVGELVAVLEAVLEALAVALAVPLDLVLVAVRDVVRSVASWTMRMPNALIPPGFVTPVTTVLVIPFALNVRGMDVG